VNTDNREPDNEPTVLRPATSAVPEHGVVHEDTVLVDPAALGIRPAVLGHSLDHDLDTVRGPAGRVSASPPRRDVTPPAQHRFRMPDGAEYVLDVPALIGRKPVPPRIATGPVRLIAVPSKHGEVSSTHLELRASGRVVVVTDLRSTNGTTVSVPGNAQRKLRQGESMVVTPGSLIELGDGNIVEILPAVSAEEHP
jgi:hypothetical protein